jgi:hypothetical protein
MKKIFVKEIEVVTIKKSLGFVDNGEYELKTTYKLFGIPFKKKMKK